MIFQLGIIFMFLAAGEGIVWLTGVPIPSSIIGMLLLTASLQLGWLRPEYVDRAADLLVRNIGFFFVPAGVGLMKCLGLLRDQWLPIVVATIVSTFIIIFITGWVHQWTRRSFASRHARRIAD